MPHRGPYRWSDATRRLVNCEKWVESLKLWVPFSALLEGVDDDPYDEELSEDIYNLWQRGEITIADPSPLPPMPRDQMVLTPLQFRRAMSDYGHTIPLPVPLPAMFAGCQTLRQAYDILIASSALPLAVKDEMEYALAIERDNPSVALVAEILNWNDETTDAFFLHAMTR